MNMLITPQPKSPGFTERLRQAQPTMLRAGLLGLCCGLMIIGLMENAKRFADPESMRSEERLQAQVSQADVPQADLRENRIDHLAVETASDG